MVVEQLDLLYLLQFPDGRRRGCWLGRDKRGHNGSVEAIDGVDLIPDGDPGDLGGRKVEPKMGGHPLENLESRTSFTCHLTFPLMIYVKKKMDKSTNGNKKKRIMGQMGTIFIL